MKRDINGFTVIFFALGLLALAAAANALHRPQHWQYIGVVLVVTVVFSLFPIKLPDGVTYSPGEIGYFFILVRFGYREAVMVACLSAVATGFLFYLRNRRQPRIYRIISTCGMYYFSIVAASVVRGWLPPGVFSILCSVAVFDLTNSLAFVGIQNSLRPSYSLAELWRDLRVVLVAIPVATSVLMRLLIHRTVFGLALEVLYLAVILTVIILLSEAYARADGQRRDAERKYRLIAENTSDLILLLDAAGVVQYASPSNRTAFSRLGTMCTGHPLVTFIHQADRPALEEALQGAIAARYPPPFEVRCKLDEESGEWLQAEISLSPVTSGDSGVMVTAVARSITERKQAQELLRKSDKLAVVGQLAAGVAHEVRNPLTALKGFLQLLKRDSNEAQQHYFDIMSAEIADIESIVEEFLLLAKPQAFSYRTVDMRQLLGYVVNLMEPQAAMSRVRITVSGWMDAQAVYCEEGQIRQVLVNVLKNAIEAMSGGGEVRIETTVEQQKWLTIRVSDEGEGIEPERLPRLGEPFYTTKERGTGLGLMVSYNIIQNHRGSMSIHSELGKGTEVSIRLPLGEFAPQ